MTKNEDLQAKSELSKVKKEAAPSVVSSVQGDEKQRRAQVSSELTAYFSDVHEPARASKPNAGLDANAVESLVLGLKTESNEDLLLNEIQNAKSARVEEKEAITEFSQVPETLVFSEKATYKLFKRKTKREFYINGRVLESRIGLDMALYKMVKSRARSAFCLKDDIVVFYYCNL